MPRPPTGRVPVTVKLAPAGLAAIDRRAAATGCDRSEMIRRMLKYAEERMPQPTREDHP